MLPVSFLVTVYNKAAYLGPVFAAIAAQVGEFAREVIAVDDGSTDGSLELLHGLAAQYDNVRVIAQKNAGASAALNRAAAEARYPLLKLVDADDLLFSDATRLLVQALDAHGAVLAAGPWAPYDARQGISPLPARTLESCGQRRLDDPLPLILRHSRYNPSCMLVRREQYLAVGGCDPVVTCQDYSLALKLARLGPFVEIDVPVALMARGDPDRLSADKGRELMNVTHALERFIRDNQELPVPLKRLALRRAAGRALHWARRHGAPDGSWPYLWRTLAARLPLSLDYASHIGRCCRAFTTLAS